MHVDGTASMQESSDGKWSFGLDAHFHLMMLARLGPHMALSAIFAQSSRADVLASLPPACPNFQACFFSPFSFWVLTKMHPAEDLSFHTAGFAGFLYAH